MAILPGGGQRSIQASGQRYSDGRGRRLRPGAALDGDSTPVADADQCHGAAVLQVESSGLSGSDGTSTKIALLCKSDCHTITPFSMIVPP